MEKVTIYVTDLCPFCWRAKRLLDIRGVEYNEVDVIREPERRLEMVERSGGLTSVPQIFIGELHVGGSDELVALDESGELEPLLKER